MSQNTQTPPDGADSGPVSIQRVLTLALRTLPYLKASRRDLLRLVAIVLPLLPVVVVLGMLLADLFFNRMLRGEPVTALEARLLMLDPALYVEVDKLDVAAREVLRGKLVAFVMGLIVIGAPIGVGIFFYLLRLVQRINQGLRVEMMGQVQAMSMRHHSGARVGDSIYHAYQDSAVVTDLMTMLVRPVLPLLGAVWWALFVWIFDLKLTLSLLAMYVLAVLLARRFGPRLRSQFRQARERNASLTSRIQETMSAIKVVKAFGAEKLEQERFEEASNAAFASAYAARSNVALYGILGFVLASIPVLAANSYLAVWAAEKQGIAAGAALAFTGFAVWNLGAFNYAMGRMLSASGSVRRLLSHWGVVQDMTVAMERAFSQVDLDPEVQDAEDAEELPGLEREVSFEGVSFAYQQDRPVLQGVSLTAKAGSITALVGPTGSGKSTLVSLLLRLFDPDAGSVAIDGKDIKRFTIDSLRARIGIALQENLLFGTSIRENIRYAVPEASDEAVREAARIACADEFIERQPEGYDTPLGERGSKLSTGQRQRLSIARAIIKDTPVLVLDEPTASLDAETELRVLENLHAWGEGRAIFLITHRLSTIRQADHIVYLRDGRVLEQGSHAELMAREGGAYRRFVELEEGHHNEGTTPLPRQEAAS